jgi:hypothetical protein
MSRVLLAGGNTVMWDARKREVLSFSDNVMCEGPPIFIFDLRKRLVVWHLVAEPPRGNTHDMFVRCVCKCGLRLHL